jgi:hypothetical protein
VKTSKLKSLRRTDADKTKGTEVQQSPKYPAFGCPTFRFIQRSHPTPTAFAAVSVSASHATVLVACSGYLIEIYFLK